MKEFKDGVSWYSFRSGVIRVGFPEGDECCHWCRFIKKTNGIDRKECLLTGDIIYCEHIIPDECPLKSEFKED